MNIFLDFQEKKISGALESGDMRTSGFDDLERIAGNLILQDAERGLGWSMAISEKNGKMTLSATGDQVVFVVFGAFTGLDPNQGICAVLTLLWTLQKLHQLLSCRTIPGTRH